MQPNPITQQDIKSTFKRVLKLCKTKAEAQEIVENSTGIFQSGNELAKEAYKEIYGE